MAEAAGLAFLASWLQWKAAAAGPSGPSASAHRSSVDNRIASSSRQGLRGKSHAHNHIGLALAEKAALVDTASGVLDAPVKQFLPRWTSTLKSRVCFALGDIGTCGCKYRVSRSISSCYSRDISHTGEHHVSIRASNSDESESGRNRE